MSSPNTERRHIFLIGFMGTGKSTVGQLLAARLGRQFVDLDNCVEQRAGSTVVELFERGEAVFREQEEEALKMLLGNREAQIIATGGGAPCYRENLKLMKQGGHVVCLSATPEEILKRVGNAASRPLLADTPDRQARIVELLRARAPFYEQAQLSIDTTRRAPSEIATEIANEVKTWR